MSKVNLLVLYIYIYGIFVNPMAIVIGTVVILITLIFVEKTNQKTKI